MAPQLFSGGGGQTFFAANSPNSPPLQKSCLQKYVNCLEHTEQHRHGGDQRQLRRHAGGQGPDIGEH